MTAAFRPSSSRRCTRPLAPIALSAGSGHSPYGTLGSQRLISCVCSIRPKSAPLMVAPSLRDSSRYICQTANATVGSTWSSESGGGCLVSSAFGFLINPWDKNLNWRNSRCYMKHTCRERRGSVNRVPPARGKMGAAMMTSFWILVLISLASLCATRKRFAPCPNKRSSWRDTVALARFSITRTSAWAESAVIEIAHFDTPSSAKP